MKELQDKYKKSTHEAVVVFGFAQHTVLLMYKRNSGPSVITYVSLLIIHIASLVDAFAYTLI